MSEPTPTGRPGSRRWTAYLDWLREDVILAVLRLSHQEQRTARVPSGWSPLELLNHLLHMEQRWFVWGFLAKPVADPWGDWNVADPGRPPPRVAPAWRAPDGATAEDLAAQLRAVGRRTTEIVAGHPPEERARIGGRFAADPPTLEWICFHVLTEYARHAGHLDVVVEIGGA